MPLPPSSPAIMTLACAGGRGMQLLAAHTASCFAPPPRQTASIARWRPPPTTRCRPLYRHSHAVPRSLQHLCWAGAGRTRISLFAAHPFRAPSGCARAPTLQRPCAPGCAGSMLDMAHYTAKHTGSGQWRHHGHRARYSPLTCNDAPGAAYRTGRTPVGGRHRFTIPPMLFRRGVAAVVGGTTYATNPFPPVPPCIL